jgi:hypothetical protein
MYEIPATNEGEQSVLRNREAMQTENCGRSTQHSALSIQPKKSHSDAVQFFADFPQQGGIFAGAQSPSPSIFTSLCSFVSFVV